MGNLSDNVEEVLLAISASGFDWVATIARNEILAETAEDTPARRELSVPDHGERAQLVIIEKVLDRFRA